jgi:hypothetical protein
VKFIDETVKKKLDLRITSFLSDEAAEKVVDIGYEKK